MNFCGFAKVLDSFFEDSFPDFKFFRFDSGYFVLLDFIGPVSHELVVWEFLLGGHSPGSQAPEYFIGLGGWMHVYLFQLFDVQGLVSL
jgi:hypothetical protein